jgi:hypothetical protein
MTNITRIVLGDKVLAELLANKTVAILGKDRKLDGNIVITFGIPGSIEYDNLTTTIQQGQTATLECEGLIFKTNVIVKTFEDVEEPDDPEEPEEPDAPVEPVELEAPFIYLEDIEEDDEEGDAACAVLGVGKLGQMVLGKEQEPIAVAYRLVPNDYGNTLILNIYTTEVTDDGTTVVVG